MAIKGKPGSELASGQEVRAIPCQTCVPIQDSKAQTAGPVEVNDSDLMGLWTQPQMFVLADSVRNCHVRDVSASLMNTPLNSAF